MTNVDGVVGHVHVSKGEGHGPLVSTRDQNRVPIQMDGTPNIYLDTIIIHTKDISTITYSLHPLAIRLCPKTIV